jgi:ubiquinone/menaquinone biosynthesis C-methylase UbiE
LLRFFYEVVILKNIDKTSVAVAIFNKYATEYQNKFMNVSLYKDTFDFFCDCIKNKNASILEVACGPGNITNYLLNRRPNFKILGIDLSANMIDLAKINNPAAEFQLMDCRNIGTIKEKFDGIVSGFCLPYLSKQETFQFINDASCLLKINGVLYISTMEDDYKKSGLRKGSSGEEMYMHYHQSDYLVKSLEENDFKIADLQRKEYQEQNSTKTVDLIIIAVKTTPSTTF